MVEIPAQKSEATDGTFGSLEYRRRTRDMSLFTNCAIKR